MLCIFQVAGKWRWYVSGELGQPLSELVFLVPWQPHFHCADLPQMRTCHEVQLGCRGAKIMV